ncbi:MAG: hypothetical protein WKF89_18525, partial [Chitinophagaceae bacterium]
NYLVANFLSATEVSSRELALLPAIKKQLVWLKLGNSSINDSAMAFIGQCSALTFLQLNNTGITDKGLAALSTLENLHSLNLVGTNITEEGVIQLKNLKKLHSLYLYQTSIKKNAWSKLVAAFPHTALDSGGYRVPVLASDTMLVKPPETR